MAHASCVDESISIRRVILYYLYQCLFKTYGQEHMTSGRRYLAIGSFRDRPGAMLVACAIVTNNNNNFIKLDMISKRQILIDDIKRCGGQQMKNFTYQPPNQDEIVVQTAYGQLKKSKTNPDDVFTTEKYPR